MLELNFT